MPTQITTERFGMVLPPAVMSPQRTHSVPRSLSDPLPGVCTGNHHMLVHGAALLTMRDSRGVGYLLREVDAPLGTQVGSCTQDAVISRAPFFVQYYGTGKAHGSHEGLPTVSVRDRHAMVTPDKELRAEDCYFRMLQPHEIGAAMAFPGDYVVLGNKREKVKQFGNAVTPPAMEWLIRRVAESLGAKIVEGAA